MLHGSDALGAGRGLLVLTQASSEAAHVVASGLGQPGGERVRGAGADQGTKAEGEIANHGQRLRQRQQPLDTDAIRFRRQQPSQLRASGPHAGLDMSQADEKLARPGSLLAHSVTTRIPPAKSATRRSPQNRTPLRQHSGQRRSSTAQLEVKRMPLTSYSAPHGVARQYQFASDVTGTPCWCSRVTSPWTSAVAGYAAWKPIRCARSPVGWNGIGTFGTKLRSTCRVPAVVLPGARRWISLPNGGVRYCQQINGSCCTAQSYPCFACDGREPLQETLVTVAFEEQDGKTRMLLPSGPVQRSRSARRAHREGWSGSFDRIEALLAPA